MRCLLLLLLCVPILARGAGAVYVMDLPVRVDSVKAGSVTATIRDMKLVSIHRDSFMKMADGYLSSRTISAVSGLADADGNIAVEKIHRQGLTIRFDPARLEIVLSPTEQQRKLRTLAPYALGGGGLATPGSALSAYINYNLSKSYVHQSRFAPTGAVPLTGYLDGAFQFGFAGTAALEWQALYDAGRDQAWTRGDTRLVVDDQPRAIRYALGDLSYQTTEFQGGPNLLGFSAERRYGALQPFNIISSAGQQSFSIQQTSRVDVYVNGVLQTTRRLLPGRYNLSDFAFSEGLNDVELVITDDFGRVQRLSYSLFLDSTLLKAGISEFSFNAGYQRQNQTAPGIDYDFGAPAFSGFYRYGITSNLTLGAQLQADETHRIYGTEGVFGTAIGTFGTTVSASESPDYGSALGASARWKYEIPIAQLLSPLTLQWTSIYLGKDFLPLGQDEPIATFRTQHQLRLSSQLPGSVFFSLSYRQADAYPTEGVDEKGVGLSLSHSFDPVNVNLNLDHVHADSDETSVLLNVSVPLGTSRQIRGYYDRQGKKLGVEYSDYPVNVAGDLSGTFRAERDWQGGEEHQLTGTLNYTANRYIAQLEHDFSEQGFFDGQSEERSRLNLAGALVFADGTAALSRPVYDAFALVKRHPSLSDSEILVNPTPQGATAIADDFGPAVVPSLMSYRAQDLFWRATRLPAGYDMGNTERKFTPAYKSGFAYTAGSAASVIAMGSAVTVDGQPIALQSGVIKPADGREFPERQTFTNRQGRFVIQKLEPGRYRLSFSSGATGTFSIPEGAIGYVNLGIVKLGDSP